MEDLLKTCEAKVTQYWDKGSRSFKLDKKHTCGVKARFSANGVNMCKKHHNAYLTMHDSIDRIKAIISKHTCDVLPYISKVSTGNTSWMGPLAAELAEVVDRSKIKRHLIPTRFRLAVDDAKEKFQEKVGRPTIYPAERGPGEP